VGLAVKNPPGRPVIEIDWKKVDDAVKCQCTCEEVAGKLGISTDTLIKRIQEKDGGIYSGFTAYSESKKKAGLSTLRESQFYYALKGNSSLLCKLGDVYLGQAQKQDHLPPNDALLNIVDQLTLENQSLKEQLDALKRQANQVICGSDSTVQHLGGGDESGQDIHINPEASDSS
jgi:hypothetical protein